MSQAMVTVNRICFLFCLLIIGLVIIQAVLFIRNALMFNKKHRVLSEDEVRSVMKIGCVSAIAPACSIIVVALGLVSLIGPVLSFMRVGVIGSAAYETQMAEIAASTLGVTLGTEGITESTLTLCLFTMTLGSAPFLINTLIMVKPMDDAMVKAAKSSRSFLPAFSLAAMMALLVYLGANNASKSSPNLVGFAASALCTFALTKYVKKSGKKSLGNFTMSIAMRHGGLLRRFIGGTVMEENNVMTKEQLQEDYSNVYVKKVHLIGRATMAIAFILMFAPVLYMHFVAGFTAPADAYMACAAAACAAGVGGWIAEPISYFPILGAAGTYMSYLAGNVGNTRVPVAVAVQSATDSDNSSPRGQMATVIGVGMSIFFSLIVLTVIILVGSAMLQVVPEPVLKALGYVLPCLYGSMLTMRLMANFKGSIKYVPLAFVVFLVCRYTGFTRYGLLTDIAVTCIFAYILHQSGAGKN